MKTVWIMDVFIRDSNAQLAKFNGDRGAVCDCGDPDKHGKYIKGEPKNNSPKTHKGIYHTTI